MRILDFHSFEQFLAQAQLPAHPGHNYDLSQRGSKSWSGTRSFDETLQLATQGWPEGLATLKARLNDLPQQHNAPLPTYDHAVAGFAPDVPAYLAGQPCNMYGYGDDAPRAHKIVSITVNISASACIDAQQIINRGAAVVAQIDAIESQGDQCELTLVHSCHKSQYRIPVKRAGEPVEMDRLAFMFIQPSVLRRLIFRLHEQDLDLMNDYGDGYGCPTRLPKDHDWRQNTVYFDEEHSYHQCNTPERAADYVTRQFDAA